MSLLSSQLQAFAAIVRRGTVHGAADDLRLTQTGVTQRIRSLESNLRITLFVRSRKGMKLTEEGEALWRYCQGAEDLEGQVLAQLRGQAEDHNYFVSLTGPTSMMSARIAPALLSLYRRWPNLYIHFRMDDTAERIQMLRSGRVQMAIVPPEYVANEMDSKKLKADKYVLVASPKWKGRRLADILENERIIDFYEEDPTTRNYLKQFSLLGHVKRPRLFVNTNEPLILMFSQGIGYGTLTQEVAKPYLEKGELILLNGGAVMEDPLALAWYPRPQMPEYFKAILDSIR
jgi:DNA-binding transcriptional LysR family regulator